MTGRSLPDVRSIGPARPARGAGRSGWVEPLGDWSSPLGAAVLFASLFMTWSHQFSATLLLHVGASPILNGVPHNPTAWQVYSAADVLLALLAVGLAAAALFGNRAAHQCAIVAAVIGLVFVIHAIASPPSTGTLVFNPLYAVPDYIPNSPGAGIGETFAALGLLAAIAGLALSLLSDRTGA